jgi:hypothetical protein
LEGQANETRKMREDERVFMRGRTPLMIVQYAMAQFQLAKKAPESQKDAG